MLPAERLVRCIVEGLEANQTKFFYREGNIIETIVLPDHRIRLLFVVLALKLKGWDTPLAEESKPTSVEFRWQGEQPESDCEQEIVTLANVLTPQELEDLRNRIAAYSNGKHRSDSNHSA